MDLVVNTGQAKGAFYWRCFYLVGHRGSVVWLLACGNEQGTCGTHWQTIKCVTFPAVTMGRPAPPPSLHLQVSGLSKSCCKLAWFLMITSTVILRMVLIITQLQKKKTWHDVKTITNFICVQNRQTFTHFRDSSMNAKYQIKQTFLVILLYTYCLCILLLHCRIILIECYFSTVYFLAVIKHPPPKDTSQY